MNNTERLILLDEKLSAAFEEANQFAGGLASKKVTRFGTFYDNRHVNNLWEQWIEAGNAGMEIFTRDILPGLLEDMEASQS